jgi:hypothetical protein
MKHMLLATVAIALLGSISSPTFAASPKTAIGEWGRYQGPFKNRQAGR